MIKNFEDYTQELTEIELSIIPYLINGLKTKTKDNPIKAPDIVNAMNVFFTHKEIAIKMTEPRLRKCVNHIRSIGALPIIATSKGYYVSNDNLDILEQIESLTQRANSMLKSAKGLKKFIV
jgi:hypothetical protein